MSFGTNWAIFDQASSRPWVKSMASEVLVRVLLLVTMGWSSFVR